MKDLSLYAKQDTYLSNEELKKAIEDSLEEYKNSNSKILLLVPDYTRYHSNAGYIANIIYHYLDTCDIYLLEALGTHVPMTEKEIVDMYGDIPIDRFIGHDWRNDIIKIGEIPAEYVSEVSQGLMNEKIDVEVNKRVMDDYDLIISIGQVVPHEVVGMANQSKNIFVGCGGNSMINSSHMLGAFYGMERIMGKDFSPVRKVFDYALDHYLNDIPLKFILTVTTAPGGHIQTHGLFIGRDRKYFEEAVKLAQEKNLILVDEAFDKVVVYLNPEEFKSTWLGNKAIYRTRMAIADNGQLIIIAPGIDKFGEDAQNDKLIRKYGYCGRENVIKLCEENEDLKQNLSAAAHLIHGSSDDRFTITYCTKNISQEEIENVNFKWIDYDEIIKKYVPNKLIDGFNEVDGEKIFYISNPALGLWACKDKF